jgi:aspartate/methionine/tyrosine aminotransferase
MPKLPPFALERYFAEHEFKAPHLLCGSDCQSFSLKEILAFQAGSAEHFQDLWLGYTESLGQPALRAAIASLYTATRADQIIVFAGAQEGILAFMQAALEPGDHIIVHYPAYQSLFEIARSLGCQVTLWPAREEDGWQLDLDFVRKNVTPRTKAVVINCPHNPTGYLMPARDFQSLVNLSQEHGFLVFSDEVYRLLEFDAANRLPALCDLDERGLSLGVMSKSFGLAGLRIGWIATRNRRLFDQLAAFKDYTTICNSAPSEFLATIALRHTGAIVSRNLAIIRSNLETLEAFFVNHREIFSWSAPEAGPIAFPGLKNRMASADFCREVLNGCGVLLLPGSLYGKDYAANFRIGFGRRDFKAGLEHLELYLRTRAQAK